MSESIENKADTPDQDAHARFAKRDAETQIALGLFVALIAVPVIIGTLWADRTSAIVVNLVSGVTLLGFGLAMAAYGFRKRAR